MFDHVSFSDGVLLFHTSPNAGQSGASTTLRLGGLAFTGDSVSIGKCGPYLLPTELREAKEFQHLLALNQDSIRVRGQSKSPRARPDWPILTYAYRLYLGHVGVPGDRELPPVLVHMIESKRLLWNALCDRFQAAIEQGQSMTAEAIDALAADVKSTLTTFNDSLGRSKHKLRFPKDDPKQIPARRVGAYSRFVAYLGHAVKEGNPVPDGLMEHVVEVLQQYPYDWQYFRTFERNILSIAAELSTSMAVPASIASPVIKAFLATFKRRRNMKMKGFDGIPHPKDARSFDWFHEEYFRSHGLSALALMAKGSSSVQFGSAVSPETSGHPLMRGRKAVLRTLRPITFILEDQNVTFGILMHRPLPANALLKQWRLLCRRGKYWANFMLEIPPYTEATSEVGGVAGLDVNWRVLRMRKGNRTCKKGLGCDGL